MKKFGVHALIVATAFAAAPAAHAAQYLSITGPSGVFGNDTVSGVFENVFTFEAEAGFEIASFDIKSIAASAETNLDFTSVTFNGTEFNTVLTGTQEFRNLLSQLVEAGTNTLRVRGVAGRDAAFSGTLAFAAGSNAIPEPATWAMMLGGFGLLGVAMRRRTRMAVTYA